MLRRMMMAITTALSELAPASQHYTTVATVSSFDRQPMGVALDFSDSFATTAGLTPQGTSGTYSTTGSELTLTASGGRISFTEGSAWAVPQGFVSVDVSLKSTNTTSNVLRVGIAKDDNNFVAAIINYPANNYSIEVKIAGTSTFLGTAATPAPSTLTAPFKFGFGIIGTRCLVYVDTGSGWTIVAFVDIKTTLNLSTSANFVGYKSFFGIGASPGPVTWKFTNFKSGVHGGDKVRDFGLVTNPDGSPYITAGEVYFSSTITAYYPTSFMGIFALDLSTYVVRQVSALLFERSGTIYQDIAGCIVRNSATSYDVWCATWGNGFGAGGTIQVQWANVAADLLAGGRFKVTGLVKPALPGLVNGDSGCYDPCIWFDGTTYTLAYTLVDTTTFTGSPFYPALATSTDRVTWTLVGADSSRQGFEGSRLLKTNASTWLLCGGPTTMHIYDSAMTYIGLLDAAVNGGGDTQPWPASFTYGSTFVMLTFDNTKNAGAQTFSWGNLIVKTAPRY